LPLPFFFDHHLLTYCSPSVLTLLGRLIPQWIYLTPKSPILPPFPVTTRPYILLFFALPLLFIVAHLLDNPAVAGEATRFYLHGGIITDFVGQLSPISKTRLVATDLLFWALQIVMLAVSLERRKLGGGDGEAAAAGANSSGGNEEAESWQAQDAAERGERRDTNAEDTENIEMHVLSRHHMGRDEAEEDLLPDGSASVPSDRHPLDDFNSGQHVIANLDILGMVRTQWSQRNAFRTATSEPADAHSSPSSAALAAVAAGRALGFRPRVGGQPLGTG